MVSHRLILAGIASAIEALSTGAYQYDSSDRWHRGRTLAPTAEPTGHLEFWVVLGPAQLSGSHGLVYQTAMLVADVRAVLDDTATCEGIIRDAALDAMLALQAWHLDVAGARTTARGYQIADSDGEWARVEIHFALHISPWRT